MEINLTKLETEVKIVMAGSAVIPIEALDFFSRDKSQEVRASAFANLIATEEILDRGLKDEVTAVKIAALRNPNISGEQIDKTVRENEDNDDVKFYAAKSPKALEKTLDYLAHDKHPIIRRCVAWNPITPSGILRWLGNNKDSEFDIRLQVERNENTPKEVRERLKKELQSGWIAIEPSIELLHNWGEPDDDD